jgi:hypothetical protein
MIDAVGISMKFYMGTFYGIFWKSFTLYFVTWAGRPHLCPIFLRNSLNVYGSKKCFRQKMKTGIKHIFHNNIYIFNKCFDFRDDDSKMTALYLRFPLCRKYSMLASGTRVRGLKPGRSRWIFQVSEKSSACLPSEGK